MKRNRMNINYIELFSGIGAFSQAIESLDYVDSHCLFAADINKRCADVYRNNYGVESLCDLTKKDENDIPFHDFCFFSPPCQAFSKSGKQKGFEDARGTLIYHVFRILNTHHPRYILMENVRNLVSHDGGRTWNFINKTLRELGYRIPDKPVILSPHYFGVPQTRERAFIPGIYDPEHSDMPLELDYGNLMKKNECTIDLIIDHTFDDDASLTISEHEEYVLNAWNEFYGLLDIKTIGFPVWAEYFKSKKATSDMPDWKIEFINKNKELYKRNKDAIDKWLNKYDNLRNFTPTQRKFEWQAGSQINSIWDGIIQFRPSGVRVKAPTTLPALVAIVQIPIIGRLRRRLSVKECANLQSFSDNFIPDDNRHEAYKQFGNSINVTVLKRVLESLLNYED